MYRKSCLTLMQFKQKAMKKMTFVCKCFYTHNFYLKAYNIHVIFENRLQFTHNYGKILRQKGCVTERHFENLVDKIETELHRRQSLGKASLERKRIIQESYIRLHPDIYTLKEEYFDSGFLSLVHESKKSSCIEEQLLPWLQETDAERVFSFPVFTEHFCKKFLEELDNFEKSSCPKGRPNTMNKYGVLLDEVGFDDFMAELRTKYLQPIATHLYPDWGGDSLDSHKAFIVKYKMGDDLDLAYHYDNAEVTLNVSLSDTFTGGSLYFGSMRTVGMGDTECCEYEHRPYVGLMHRGQHRHGALPITSGERCNLIIWMRSSKIRNNQCPMCGRQPDLVETLGNGDGFTQNETIVDVCNLT